MFEKKNREVSIPKRKGISTLIGKEDNTSEANAMGEKCERGQHYWKERDGEGAFMSGYIFYIERDI